MRFDLEHFQTKLGRKIVGLFLLCALLPTLTLSFFSYRTVRSKDGTMTSWKVWLGIPDTPSSVRM